MKDSKISSKNEFHGIVRAIFIFWIFASLIASYGKWTEYENSNYDFGLYQFLGTVIICLGLAIILWYKSIIGFYIIVIASFSIDITLSIVFETKLSISEIIIVDAVRILIISLVLCIKKDGRFAWDVISDNNPFTKKKVIDIENKDVEKLDLKSEVASNVILNENQEITSETE